MQYKSDLRRRLIQQRLSLSEDQVDAKSALICQKVKGCIDPSNMYAVHYFEAITSLHEVNLSALINSLHTSFPNLLLHTSRKLDDQWLTVTSDGDRVTDTIRYDCIIVPMLGFDARLHRIGYGGGYYDRLLSQQPAALKIGVCFETTKLDRIEPDTHDIALDMIVTERTVYRRPKFP